MKKQLAGEIYEKKQCKRCGRTDLEILSNGLCKRCDEVRYGSGSPMVPYVPKPWEDKHYRPPWKWVVYQDSY